VVHLRALRVWQHLRGPFDNSSAIVSASTSYVNGASRLGLPYWIAEKGSDLDDWSALAEALTTRMGERGINQRELAERSGVSVATIRQIQGAKPARRSAVTLAALSRALGYPDDHLRRVLRQEAPQEESRTVADLAERLEAVESQVRDLAGRVRQIETGHSSERH
jgi:transcriptional regulator with XRE-family HTH domain